VIDALASLFFYARFLRPFSRIGYRRRARGFDPAPFDLGGQRWVVSGCTGGIGQAIALGAAKAGAQVVGLARSADRLQHLARSATGPGAVLPRAVDLSLMRAVREAAAGIAAEGRIDVLVNNVGLMLHDFSQTAEGVETSLATNLLGQFVLTEALREAGALDSRSLVLSMSSGGMYGARLDPDLLEAGGAGAHNGLRAYAQHKRAQVELTRHWNGLGPDAPTALVMHPGWVDTEGVRTALPVFRRVLRTVLRTPEEGADTALWLGATRPAPRAEGGIWLDRQCDPEHAFAFTRGGISAGELAQWLAQRARSAG
jgi:dehydrogenase/reductase SDR family member 12